MTEQERRDRKRNDNLGSPTVDVAGGVDVGIGSGLTIDPADGSLGVQVAPGVSIDFDGD